MEIAPGDINGNAAALQQGAGNDEARQLRDHLVLQPPPQRPRTKPRVIGLLQVTSATYLWSKLAAVLRKGNATFSATV